MSQEESVTLGEYLKRNSLFLLVGILALLAGLWVDAQWFRRFSDATWVAYAVNLLPGLLVLLFWFLASTFRRLRWFFLGSGLLLALLATVVAYLMFVGSAVVTSAITPIQDPTLYEELLDVYPQEWVAHFPVHIPGSATQVAFFYLPAFLQGGSYLQLRCQLPSSEVEAVLKKYRPVTRPAESETTWLSVIEFSNGTSGQLVPVPNDFVVLILDEEIENHGYAYGVAVSTERQEVIYWAEYW